MLQDLLELCRSHAWLWPSVWRHLSKPDRDAVAACCSQARRQSNAAVTTVHLKSHRDALLQLDLLDVFPHAGVLELLVDCSSTEQPLSGDEAAALLDTWAGACPGLLAQVTHLTLDCWDTHLVDSPAFRKAFVTLLQRCSKLENLVVSTSATRHTDADEIPNDLHLRFSGAPAATPHTIRLDAWLAGASIPPRSSSSLPHTTPAAARMALQLDAFRAHPDLADAASWPNYPCLVEISIHPRLPTPSLLPCAALCQSLQSLELCHLAAAPVPPVALEALRSLPHLAELRLAAYAVDGTPLASLWDAVGGLPTLRSLHLLHGAHPDDITDTFTVPQSWSQLTNMTRLYITIGHPVRLQQLAPLTSLHRLYVQLAAGHLSHLATLSQLTALKMDSGDDAQLAWADAGTGAVTWGAQLHELDVEGCLDMAAPAVGAVGRLTGLRVVRLCLAEGTPAAALLPLAGLAVLEELSVANPPLEPQLWRILSKLHALKTLQLQIPEDETAFVPRLGPPTPPAPEHRARLPALQHLSATFHTGLSWALAWCIAPRIQSAFAECPPDPSGSPAVSCVWLQPSQVHSAWLPALLNGLSPAARGPSDSPADAAPPLFALLTDADADILLDVPGATLVRLGFQLQIAGNGDLSLAALQRLLRHVTADPAAAAQLQLLHLAIEDLSPHAPGQLNGSAFAMAIEAFRPSLQSLHLWGCQGLAPGWMLSNALAAPQLRDVFLQHADAVTDELLLQLANRSQQLHASPQATLHSGSGTLDDLQISGGRDGCPGITLAGVLPLVASGAVKRLMLYKPGIFQLEQAAHAVRQVLHPGQRVTLLQPGQVTAIGPTCGVCIEWAPGADAAAVMLMGMGHNLHFL